MIFVDTSAFYALADRADRYHNEARTLLTSLLSSGEPFVTHNYAIVESIALMQHRLGIAPAKKFLADMEHFCIVWVDEQMHAAAQDDWARQKRARVSFVDCISFTLMRNQGIKRAFAFDKDFVAAGFILCR